MSACFWSWALVVGWMVLSTFSWLLFNRNKKLLATNNELQEAADAMIAHAFETSRVLRERIAELETALEERDHEARGGRGS